MAQLKLLGICNFTSHRNHQSLSEIAIDVEAIGASFPVVIDMISVIRRAASVCPKKCKSRFSLTDGNLIAVVTLPRRTVMTSPGPSFGSAGRGAYDARALCRNLSDLRPPSSPAEEATARQ